MLQDLLIPLRELRTCWLQCCVHGGGLRFDSWPSVQTMLATGLLHAMLSKLCIPMPVSCRYVCVCVCAWLSYCMAVFVVPCWLLGLLQGCRMCSCNSRPCAGTLISRCLDWACVLCWMACVLSKSSISCCFPAILLGVAGSTACAAVLGLPVGTSYRAVTVPCFPGTKDGLIRVWDIYAMPISFALACFLAWLIARSVCSVPCMYLGVL